MPRIALIVPARIGSKRIKEKNIKMIAGRPLIYWTLQTANLVLERLKDACLYLSSESDKIIDVVTNYHEFDNVSIIRRPQELATDSASVIDVLRHANQTINAQLLVMLYPTYPLRTADLVLSVIDYALFLARGSVITVLKVTDNVFWYVTSREGGRIEKLLPNVCYRTQDAPRVYKMAGAVHAIWKNELPMLDLNGMNDSVYYYLVLDKVQCLETDDEIAWEVGEKELCRKYC